MLKRNWKFRKTSKTVTGPPSGLSPLLCLLLPDLVIPWENDLCRGGVTVGSIRMCFLYLGI